MENPDNGLGVRFFLKPFENHNKSREAGRPIFDDREMIEIIFPADRKRTVVAPANEMHYVPHHKQQMTYAERFKPIYEQWKTGNAEYVHGTPLSQAAFATPAMIEEMKREKIVTVEQLAGLPDNAVARLGPGWRERRDQAQAFLKSADSTSEIAALRAEIERLKAGQKVEPTGDQFDGFTDEDLMNMATDAGLEPRANASRKSLVKMLAEKAKEAA